MEDQKVETQVAIEKPITLVVDKDGQINHASITEADAREIVPEIVKEFDQKDAYWRKRIGDKITSMLGQLAINFYDINNMMKYCSVNKEKGQIAINKITDGFQELMALLKE